MGGGAPRPSARGKLRFIPIRLQAGTNFGGARALRPAGSAAFGAAKRAARLHLIRMIAAGDGPILDAIWNQRPVDRRTERSRSGILVKTTSSLLAEYKTKRKPPPIAECGYW